MPTFATAIAAVGLLCFAAQAVKVQNFTYEYIEDLGFVNYAISRNIKKNLAYMTRYSTKEAQTGDLQFTLKIMNGTENHRIVNIIVPNTRNIICKSEIKLLYTDVLENTIVIVWVSNCYEERLGWVSLVDEESLDIVHKKHVLEEDGMFLVLVDRFGVSVCMSSKVMCGEQPNSCMIRFNRTGGEVSKFVQFRSKNYAVAMVVDELDPKSGWYFVDLVESISFMKTMIISHVSYNGSETVLASQYRYETGNRNSLSVSNDNGYLTLCHEANVFMDDPQTCMQLALNGKVDVIPFSFQLHKWMHKIFNQRQGGIIVIYCKNEWIFCFRSPVWVQWLTTNGTVSREVELAGVELNGLYKEFMFSSVNYLETDTEHCFYIAHSFQSDANSKTRIKYFNKCIDK